MIESMTCLCLMLADPQLLSAQPTNGLTISVAYKQVNEVPYERTVDQPTYRCRTQPQEQIFRRAAYSARKRAARIELRKWQGISLLRPHHPRRVAPSDWYPYAGAPWHWNRAYIWAR